MDPGRVAVCVSGKGSNLRALHAAERRGALGGRIVLVLGDRDCPGLDFAAAQGIATATVRPGDHPDRDAWDAAVTDALRGAEPDVVVLAGFMRWVGPPALDAFTGRILNVHPSLLPAFPGAHAVRDALAAGVAVTGVTVHIVDETRDAGPIVLQEAVEIRRDEAEEALLGRLHAVEHRLLPRAVALMLAGAVEVRERRVAIDPQRAAVAARPRRALLSVSDKRGIVELGAGLAELGFELVSTGGTARALRETGLQVTDVAAVTGVAEMLDGRVKTLHPRVAAGVLADLRREDHREQLATAGIDPFELVVVNLYPFAEALDRQDATPDDVIEEIDIGGPTLVRAAAKNHASVAILTDPGDYGEILAELRGRGHVSEASRRRLAAEAFAHTARYDGTIAGALPGVLGLSSAGDATDGDASDREASDGDEPFPRRVALTLERVAPLRYGENPHQAAALYHLHTSTAPQGPFAREPRVVQGKELSYNNILDASAAAAIARDLRGAGVAIVKHANPCGAAEGDDPVAAWQGALAGDPVSAFGGVVAVRWAIDRTLAEALTSMFLEVVVAPSVDDDALEVLARRPNLRVVLDLGMLDAPRPAVEYRSAGGGVLATDADVLPDDPTSWRTATAREPSAEESRDLDLAWRVVRHVKSNAIVLVRSGAVVGVGAGQMSRVDSARLAVEKAGPERARGAVCASDAFYPFPDAVEVCTRAGVTAFVQPGGSQRDAEVIAAADTAGAAMLLTGRRHFRH